VFFIFFYFFFFFVFSFHFFFPFFVCLFFCLFCFFSFSFCFFLCFYCFFLFFFLCVGLVAPSLPSPIFSLAGFFSAAPGLYDRPKLRRAARACDRAVVTSSRFVAAEARLVSVSEPTAAATRVPAGEALGLPMFAGVVAVRVTTTDGYDRGSYGRLPVAGLQTRGGLCSPRSAPRGADSWRWQLFRRGARPEGGLRHVRTISPPTAKRSSPPLLRLGGNRRRLPSSFPPAVPANTGFRVRCATGSPARRPGLPAGCPVSPSLHRRNLIDSQPPTRSPPGSLEAWAVCAFGGHSRRSVGTLTV